MNRKGFTLVELLSVIVLIGLLFGIGIPGVMKISDKMKKKALNTKIDLIEQAATLWGQDNKTRLYSKSCFNTASSTCLTNEEVNTEDNCKCYLIKINELIEENYLDSDNNSDEYINPTNNSDMINECVYVYKKNNRVYAKFDVDQNFCDE